MGLVRDVGLRDLILVQSELFMLASFFLIIGFAIDISHRLLDSRFANNQKVSE